MNDYTAILPDLSKGYCVIDTETSGLDPDKDRVIELALLVYQGGEITVRTSLIKSVDRVPPKITSITGITTQMLRKEGRDPAEVFARFYETAELHGLPVVGHNILSFDRPFLLREALRLTGAVDYWAAEEALKEACIIDTGALYKGMKLGEKPRPGETHQAWTKRVLKIRASGLYWNLEAAATSYGITVSGQHRAGSDTRTAQQLLAKILEEEGKG